MRALVNHLVYENRWAPELLTGRTMAEVGDAHDGDLVGDDPVAAFESSATAAIAAWNQLSVAAPRCPIRTPPRER